MKLTDFSSQQRTPISISILKDGYNNYRLQANEHILKVPIKFLIVRACSHKVKVEEKAKKIKE